MIALCLGVMVSCSNDKKAKPGSPVITTEIKPLEIKEVQCQVNADWEQVTESGKMMPEKKMWQDTEEDKTYKESLEFVIYNKEANRKERVHAIKNYGLYEMSEEDAQEFVTLFEDEHWQIVENVMDIFLTLKQGPSLSDAVAKLDLKTVGPRFYRYFLEEYLKMSQETAQFTAFSERLYNDVASEEDELAQLALVVINQTSGYWKVAKLLTSENPVVRARAASMIKQFKLDFQMHDQFKVFDGVDCYESDEFVQELFSSKEETLAE